MELLDYGKLSSEVNIDACSKMIEVNIDACNIMIEVKIERLSTKISLREDQFKTEGEYWLFGVVRLW